MIVYTNSKTVKAFIQERLMNVCLIENVEELTLSKTNFNHPLFILTVDFIRLELLLVSYFHRKPTYEIAILSDEETFKTEQLLSNDVLALLSNVPLLSDITSVIEKYKYRRDLFQSKKAHPLLIALNAEKIIIASDIRFIRAYGNYTLIFTTNERIVERVPFAVIQEKLPKDCFVQTHRSFVINISKVDDIKQRFLKIGRDNIPISARKRKEVISRFRELQLIV